MSKRARHRIDETFTVNKNLLLLLISIVLVIIGFWVLVESTRDCETVRYQDLHGEHSMIVCKGNGY